MEGSRNEARPRRGLTPERVLALVGVAGLLAVAAVIAAMVSSAADGGDDERAAAPPAERRGTAKPAKNAKRKPAKKPKPKLTTAQRAQREAAATQLRNQGFEAVRLSSWRPEHTLRVLIGSPADEPSAGQRAFFFVRNAYIGTDSTDPSAGVRIGKQSDNRVTLVYKLADRSARVRFQWDGSRLQPIDPIPPPAARAPTTG